MSSGFAVRCRNCRRVVLTGVSRILDRECNELLSHLKTCRPDLVARDEERWRRELGTVLEQFDVVDVTSPH